MAYPAKNNQNVQSALADFVSACSFTDVPAPMIETIQRAFADTLAVSVAAKRSEVSDIITEVVGPCPGDDDGATVFAAGCTTSVADAALANATMSHSLDFDDVTRDSWHPSAPIVGPILAVAESRNLSGREAVTAYAVGYEVQSYLASELLPSHYERGWHTTATLGTFGAAAAVANLLELNPAQARHTLGIAASMPAGLKKNFGTMTKPLHVGHAARSGTTAATLASKGFTASNGVITDDRGFLDLYSGAPADEFRTPLEEDSTWELTDLGIQIKKYPCCNFAHTSIASTQELIADRELSPQDIRAVHVTLSPGGMDILPYTEPTTGLEAKFSANYGVAAAIIEEQVDIATFEDDRVSDPSMQQFLGRVTVEQDSTLPYNSYQSVVRIETTAGDTFDRSRTTPPGTPETPISDAELYEKFVTCVRWGEEDFDPEPVFDSLIELADAPNIAGVVEPF